MNAVIAIEGGLGKNIMALSLMEKLKEKYKEIYVISPYFDLYKCNPYVTDAFSMGQYGLYEQLILRDDTVVLWKEPYNNNRFIKKKCHLLDAWCEELDIEYKTDLYPIINVDQLSPKIKKDVDYVKKEIGQNYIIVQFVGGQSPVASNDNYDPKNEALKRNYFKGEEIVNYFSEKYKVVNYNLLNELTFRNSMKFQLPYICYAELIKSAVFTICIDSSLQHMAASTDTPTFVIWGETRPEHFGWDKHINMSKPVLNTTAYFKPLGPSPYKIDFWEPEEIIERIKKEI